MKRRDFLQITPLLGLISFPSDLLNGGGIVVTDTRQFNALNHIEKSRSDEVENKIFILSNFHPASCGWLSSFSKERIYCCNDYLNHLDRVESDTDYKFSISEVNNLIAIKNFQPQRFEVLKKNIQDGRVEAVNASFLECTINLSGGEALARQGIEGLRWQKNILNVSPRFMWMIDVCGMHSQMAQITQNLGLDGLFYTRGNPTESIMQWFVSPDGSYTLGISPGHYSNWRSVFKSNVPLTNSELDTYQDQVRCRYLLLSEYSIINDNLSIIEKRKFVPNNVPYLILGGTSDYSLAPKFKDYPSFFIKQWAERFPKQSVLFSVPGDFYDTIATNLKMGKIDLPIIKGGWTYAYKAFWIQNPKVKQRFRLAEYLLMVTESLATIKSITENLAYPMEELYHGWIQLLLNMDRNTLWGAAGGQVFESEDSWDANDRFNWIEDHMLGIQKSYFRDAPNAITFFNPCNWNRREPIVIRKIGKKILKNIPCQDLGEGDILCVPDVKSFGEVTFEIVVQPPQRKIISLPDIIDTKFYLAKISSKTGNLISLILKSSGIDILDGEANRIIAEVPNNPERLFGDHMVDRGNRHEVSNSDNKVEFIHVETGPVATIVTVRSKFLDNQILERTIRFYKDISRIDFATKLQNVPDKTIVAVEFPFSSKADFINRGIPYGFEKGKWGNFDPSAPANVKGIVPVIWWSEYIFENNIKVALFDRGLTGREYDGKNALIFLMATLDKYYGYENSWLSGKGEHYFEYALDFSTNDAINSITQKNAFSYNFPYLYFNTPKSQQKTSFMRTSDNLIVQALRREDNFVEVRMVEAKGLDGFGFLSIQIPHKSVEITNFIGGTNASPQLERSGYKFKVKSQQIITIRIFVDDTVKKIEPILEWDELVPLHKRKALHEYDSSLIGHPPSGK